MRPWRRCAVCSGPAEAHEIVTRGAGGPREAWNTLFLCRGCHRYFHDAGWVRFVAAYPALRGKVLEARRRAGKHEEQRT